MSIKLTVIALFLGLTATFCIADDNIDNPDYQIGKTQFQAHCIACHSGIMPEAPKVEALNLYPPERIVAALTSGVMSTAGLPLSEAEIRQVAYFLTGKTTDSKKTDLTPHFCAAGVVAPDGADWSNWGGAGNRRFQAEEQLLNRDNVKNLALKWAFAFPQSTRVRSQPTVTAAMTYIGSQDGTVYALDTDTGCIHWTFQGDVESRGAIQLHIDPGNGKRTLLFGDLRANVYSVDASTGELLWKTRVHEHPFAAVTGSVVADEDKVYVPVSSLEVVPAAQVDYPCCTFRGALVAINLSDGTIAWKTYTTSEPLLRGKSSAGADQFGPSGAPIWSSPTLDKKRNLVIATTGQNYSSPATGTSDAVIALDTASGKIQWVSQVTKNDAWNGACSRKTPNCPEEDGPDFDIGASAILITTRDNKDLLLVGQKSGLVYALDPDQKGKILWTRRVGRGGTMGGVHWGMSSDGDRLYVGISDLDTNNAYIVGEPHPGLHALDPLSGEFLWRSPLPNICPSELKFRCDPGISAAVSSSPGLVFAGGMDGMLRAFDANNGGVLWSYDTRRSYTSVNGIEGKGGSIEADGPVIVNGELFVTSGYDKWAEVPGNVLLVFSLPEK
jgi:polyvinyl alcohol dehydrogenase (cytochrome)